MKPKDFSESAVKLTNPDEVKELLEQLSAKEAILGNLKEELLKQSKEILDKISAKTSLIDDTKKAIREAVEQHGSYQDLENERYAVFVELCIKETIDVQALKGQVKGKLITEEQLEDAGVLTWDTGYSFYVR